MRAIIACPITLGIVGANESFVDPNPHRFASDIRKVPSSFVADVDDKVKAAHIFTGDAATDDLQQFASDTFEAFSSVAIDVEGNELEEAFTSDAATDLQQFASDTFKALSSVAIDVEGKVVQTLTEAVDELKPRSTTLLNKMVAPDAGAMAAAIDAIVVDVTDKMEQTAHAVADDPSIALDEITHLGADDAVRLAKHEVEVARKVFTGDAQAGAQELENRCASGFCNAFSSVVVDVEGKLVHTVQHIAHNPTEALDEITHWGADEARHLIEHEVEVARKGFTDDAPAGDRCASGFCNAFSSVVVDVEGKLVHTVQHIAHNPTEALDEITHWGAGDARHLVEHEVEVAKKGFTGDAPADAQESDDKSDISEALSSIVVNVEEKVVQTVRDPTEALDEITHPREDVIHFVEREAIVLVENQIVEEWIFGAIHLVWMTVLTGLGCLFRALWGTRRVPTADVRTAARLCDSFVYF